ncbi:MAG: hypothetical protein LVT47_05690 [Cyanobacteria bacterium LVE1205-1]|jgi:hypothetical protein
MNDPIVEETRQAREAYFKECGNTLLTLYENLKQQEANSTRRYRTLPPKPVPQLIP